MVSRQEKSLNPSSYDLPSSSMGGYYYLRKPSQRRRPIAKSVPTWVVLQSPCVDPARRLVCITAAMSLLRKIHDWREFAASMRWGWVLGWCFDDLAWQMRDPSQMCSGPLFHSICMPRTSESAEKGGSGSVAASISLELLGNLDIVVRLI